MNALAELDCSLNVTECILEAAAGILAELKQTNNEYNWDPLTFAATLIIGLVALVFAGLTIGQSLIAAGPGRHKCSRFALGPWAQLTTRYWDWSELRFRSVASTPIISIRHFLNHNLEPEKERDQNQYSSKELTEYFPATWLALLTRCKLDQPSSWALQVTAADYIPLDLSAAPAYTTIRDVVVLIGVSHDSRTWKLDYNNRDPKNLPHIQGSDFEMDFRHHPMLGIYGIYQTYSTNNGRSLKDTHDQSGNVVHALQIASGYIPIWKELQDAPQALKFLDKAMNEQNLAHVQIHRSIEIQGRILAECTCESLGESNSHAHGNLKTSGQAWCRFQKRFNVSRFRTHIFEGGLDLLAADASKLYIRLFPRWNFGLHEKLKYLFVFSRFWSRKAPKGLRSLNPPTTIGTKSGASPSFQPALVSNACFAYVESGDFDTSADRSSLLRYDKYIVNELCKVDKALKEHAETRTILCRMFSLATSAIIARWVLSGTTTTASDYMGNYGRLVDVRGEMLDITSEIPSGMSSGGISEISWRVVLLTKYIEKVSRETRDWITKCNTAEGDDNLCPWPPRFMQYPMDYNLIRNQGDAFAKEYVNDCLVELTKYLKIWELNEDGYDFKYKPVTKEQLLEQFVDDMLIYRAALVALRLHCAQDNSAILENEDFMRKVPML